MLCRSKTLSLIIVVVERHGFRKLKWRYGRRNFSGASCEKSRRKKTVKILIFSELRFKATGNFLENPKSFSKQLVVPQY